MRLLRTVQHLATSRQRWRGLRTYATALGSTTTRLTLRASQIPQVIREPHVLAGCRDIRLSTEDWGRRYRDPRDHDDDNDDDDDVAAREEARCHAELSHVLGALDSAADVVDSVVLAVGDVLALPVSLRAAAAEGEGEGEGGAAAGDRRRAEGVDVDVDVDVDVEDEAWRRRRRSRRRKKGRTPVTVLEKMGVRCTCVDLGLWRLEDYPAVVVADEATREGLLAARRFRGSKEAWWGVVQGNEAPGLKAFDYTAEFYGRRLSGDEGVKGEGKVWVDLGVFGKGYCGQKGRDVDEWSLEFARDLERNVRYFAERTWQPGLYEKAREANGGVATAVPDPAFEEGSNGSLACSDTPSGLLTELERQKKERLARKCLECGEDEEVLFTDESAMKRRKGKE
ncbi:hypothetical protein LTS18_003318 [Coniosporium uncinatum]|uniref:Uncharacterized protein n=1 Tax=Coniosporium uncinatum TaxID=93489 RepID=A0ACC3D6W3_9PEZI|nr:hypothetical protein LTS18_003318 [Coniosporium uncinatum]